MDVLYYENIKKCPFYEPTYKRPGTYFKVQIEGVELEANYEEFSDGKVFIVRAGRDIKLSHWIHIYTVYKYFESLDQKVDEIIVELENKKYHVRKNELMLKEKWIKKDIQRLKTKEKEPGSQCRFCTVKEHCHSELLKHNNLLVVPAVSSKIIEDFREMEIDPVEIVKSNQIDKFNEQYKKPLYNIMSIVYNKVYKISDIAIPDNYIIFDVETYVKRDFLFGYLIDGQYKPFVFHKRNDKRAEEMVNFLYESDRYLVHYDSHDVKALMNFAKLYPEHKNKIEHILKKTFDVFELIIKNYSIPVTSYSLKDISKYFGFEWRTNLNGYAVIIEYQRYLKGEEEIMKKILDYNEDDCRSTEVVIEKLRKI